MGEIYTVKTKITDYYFIIKKRATAWRCVKLIYKKIGSVAFFATDLIHFNATCVEVYICKYVDVKTERDFSRSAMYFTL